MVKNARPDVVIIGEATSTTLKIGQRGRAEVVVETRGKTCHSSNPEKGVNAVYHMAELIQEIRAIHILGAYPPQGTGPTPQPPASEEGTEGEGSDEEGPEGETPQEPEGETPQEPEEDRWPWPPWLFPLFPLFPLP